MTNGLLKAGVLGWPVAQSLSPRLHSYWLLHYGIVGQYTAVPTEPVALPATLDRLQAEGWKGVNLTIPHKEAALALLDDIDADARAIGAVNTIVFTGNKRLGINTDGVGFWHNIRSHSPSLDKAVIIGAGGAARAVIAALERQGCTSILLLNRTHSRAQVLAAGKPHVRVVPWQERDKALEGASLLVNTTSLGMAGQPPLELDLARLPLTALVNDIVYKPLETPLLARARARGNPVVDGLGMLLHQAVPAFEAWFNVRPEVTPQLRRYVLEGQQTEAGEDT